MANITVKLEIIGWFYSKDVTVNEGCSVADVLEAASQLPIGPLEPKLSYQLNDMHGLRKIRVEHRANAVSTKKSYPSLIKRQYAPGIYEYDDQAENVLPTNLRLVWQYYILSEKRSEKSNDGIEIPCGKSNQPLPNGVVTKKVINDEDVIRWRLVAINVGPSTTGYVKGA
jgi:hypothetical protein